jgi:Transposase zinc-binding domain/Putative transposase
VVRAYGPAFQEQCGAQLSGQQQKVLRAVAACRTATLGGHVQHCDACGEESIAYNSCRNRHCPKCQGAARARWLDREAAYLLPVEYHHVVFTLPAALGPLALQNPRVVYDLLFATVAETVRELTADPHYLGAQVGVLGVLHTWGQNLHHNPHVHCVGLLANRRRQANLARCRQVAGRGRGPSLARTRPGCSSRPALSLVRPGPPRCLDFYVGLAHAAKGPVLDIACGTGRVLLPVLQAGIDADGLDLSIPCSTRRAGRRPPRIGAGPPPRRHSRLPDAAPLCPGHEYLLRRSAVVARPPPFPASNQSPGFRLVRSEPALV